MSKHVLKSGHELILDDEDDWIVDIGSVYVHMKKGRPSTVSCTTGVYRLALKETSRLNVDHINRNPLDNRKSNLRLVSYTHNAWNRACRGYSYSKNCGKWRAEISHFGKSISLGFFETEMEAALAVWKARKELRGEFAVMPPILATAMRGEDGLIV